MQIRIQNPVTKAETTLCDGFGRGVDKSVGPNGMRVGTVRKVEPAEYLRGTDIKVYDRGNQQTQIAFAVSRQCASVGAALAWKIQHQMSCIRSGTLWLQVDEGTVRQVRMLYASITNLETNLMGVSVQISYTILGGALQL